MCHIVWVRPPFSFRVLPVLLSLLVAGACAEGSNLDDEDLDGPRRTDLDASAATDARPRTDASSGSSGAQQSSSGGGESSSSSGGEADASVEAGPTLTACQQALSGILFDADPDTLPEKATDWWVNTSDGVSRTDTSWPYLPWVISPAAGQTPIGTPCASGLCAATGLTQNYAQCQRGWIATPEADLSACAGSNVVVQFDHAHVFMTYGTFKDGGIVEMTANGADIDTATWTRVEEPSMAALSIRSTLGDVQCQPTSFYVNGKKGYVGTSPVTHTSEIAVPPAMLTAHARVRFVFASGVAVAQQIRARESTNFGWRVDNVRFAQKL